MITPTTTYTAPRVWPGDSESFRPASRPMSGANPAVATARGAALGRVGWSAVDLRIAQNVVGGRSAPGNGNMYFDKVPGGGWVGTTAQHVLPPVNGTPSVPNRINVGGSDTRTSMEQFFTTLKDVKIIPLIGSDGRGIDVVKVGRPADIRAHLEKLAVAQPTVKDMKSALGAQSATWQITTASRPQSYDPKATAIEPLKTQTDWSETTPKFTFGLTALPLQVKDLAADMKASGLGGLDTKPDSWLALGAIGGDENNRSSPYKGLYLVNRGVSGSESNASGKRGTLIAGADNRNPGWTLDKVETLVKKSAPLRAALAAKFPALTTAQAAEKLYQHGFVKIAFITKDIAVDNLKILNKTAR